MADTLTAGQYTTMVLATEQVTVNHAYYAAGHGYLDKETADWKPLVLQTGDNAGEAEDWVTPQAMGIALEALQSLPVPASDNSGTPTVLPTGGEETIPIRGRTECLVVVHRSAGVHEPLRRLLFLQQAISSPPDWNGLQEGCVLVQQQLSCSLVLIWSVQRSHRHGHFASKNILFRVFVSHFEWETA